MPSATQVQVLLLQSLLLLNPPQKGVHLHRNRCFLAYRQRSG